MLLEDAMNTGIRAPEIWHIMDNATRRFLQNKRNYPRAKVSQTANLKEVFPKLC
jgi:hypothetical protein